jgi:putative ABC transport system permease protein
MFALASAFWLEPLPFGEQESLILIREIRRGESLDMAAGASVPNFRDWREASATMASMSAVGYGSVNVTGVDTPEEIQIVTGTPNIFDVLQVQPAMGRGFRPEEGAGGSSDVVVITHRYWERRFQGKPEALGSILTLDGVPRTVVGVMAPDFEMVPLMVEAFLPSDLSDEESRQAKGWFVFGRLREGAQVEQARTEITGVADRLEGEYPEANRGWGVLVQPARKWFPGPTDSKLILLLIAVSLFGVAIACANVANLLLSRAETRMKEIAVRTALGAGKTRIVQQVLTESTLLGLVGGALGMMMSVFVIRGLNSALPAELPPMYRASLDLPTLLVTSGIAVAAGILFGLAPALHAVRGNLKESLVDGSRGGTASRGRKRLRNGFVVAQIAVALALLTGAGELRDVMNGLVFADNGFRTEGLLTFQLTLPESKYPEAQDRLGFEEEMIRNLDEIPGVEGVAVMASLPRGRYGASSFFQIEGREVEDPNQRPRTNWESVNAGYFQTLEIPHIAGRLLESTDGEDGTLVAVVNQEFAQRFFPEEESLGRRIEIQGALREIVGVVGNIMHRRIPFDGMVEPAVFLPLPQLPPRNPSVALRTAGIPLSLVSDVRAALRAIDPDQPITSVRSMEDHIEYEVAALAFLARFVSALGVLAIFLSALGIYGVMAHSVLQERREMGIRLAVGARAGQLMGMVTRRGLFLSAVGLALGAPMALGIHWGVLRALSLFDAEVSYGMILVAGGLLALVAFFASYLPARSAAKVEPTRALSME